jgi:hypothetical protein
MQLEVDFIMENEKEDRNWLNGIRNKELRKLLANIPSIAGAYFGWKHGGELSEYAVNLGDSAELFYHQISASLPLVAKVTGACLEGKVIHYLGRFVSGALEKASEYMNFNSIHSEYLNRDFEPEKTGTSFDFSEQLKSELIDLFVRRAKKKGRFKSIHLETARKKIGQTYLNEMYKSEYIDFDTKYGIPLVSPTARALRITSSD